MKQLIGIGSGILTASLLAGCATSSADYTPPSQTTATNAKTYPIPFDAAWDKLVKNLASDFFVINNIDKNSRLINVSFSSQKPSEHIDCGITSRSFENMRGAQKYTYYTADSSQFTGTSTQGRVANVDRKTKLDGRINIYVAPEGTGTTVNVNTKYVLNIETRAYIIGGGLTPANTLIADFSTKTPYFGKDFSCYAKGNIEDRILSFIEN